MARFDAAVFAQGLVTDALAEALGFQADGSNVDGELASAVVRFERDVKATLEALEILTDARIVQLLHEDVQRFLPARRAALEAVIASRRSAEIQAQAKTILDVAVKATFAAARAFMAGA